ncbi:hypothetical protein [Brachybacterium sp. FME24]|uniref:hypothetical protein n=1 Tax=Brachybacterium sp. FME24 TaxID=2742605 RepID=UPI0018666D72|nr:hypothetical protein [Brachybacterium sp. FME24]
MPSMTIGKTPVAWRLLRYTVKPKSGSTKKERVLHAAGLRCRPETSTGEFAAVRRRHGKQGAMRKSPARYELPGHSEEATHVRDTRPGGRRYWREGRDDETATHVKHEGGYVRQNEAVHFIIGFGPDEVNPQDPEQVAHAFEYTVAHFRETMPGLQVHLVGQADGKGMTPDPTTGEVGGKFHVHAVANAVVYEDMEIAGRVWHAGSKMSGALTDIDSVRERHDVFMRENPDWGFTQKAKSVAEQKKEKRSVMDRRMRSRGERSNHDIIRDAMWSALHDPRSVDDAFRGTMGDARTVDRSAFEAVMAEYGADHGLSVEDPGWRRGKPPKQRKISYKLDGMATNVRGETLGEQYEAGFIYRQLCEVAAGRDIEPRVESAVVGPARPVTKPTDDELTEARATIEELVREEELDAWVADWARAEDVSVEELLDERGMLIDDAGHRERLRQSMNKWKAAKQKQADRAAPKPHKAQTTAPTKHKGKVPSEAEPRQLSRRTPAIPDISTDVDRRMRESGLVAEDLLREFERRKTAPTTPEESQDVAQPPVGPQGDTSEKTGPSAPAPVVTAATVAPAPSVSGEYEEYRSPMREMTSKWESRREFYVRVAAFDEEARRVLARGERIDEETVPKGVGAQFLDAFAHQLDPTVADQLWLRQAKEEKVDAAFEQEKKAQAAIDKIGSQAEERGDLTKMWLHAEPTRELIRSRDVANRRRDKLREEIDRGIYEVVRGRTPAVLGCEEQDEPQRQQDGPSIG